MGFCKLKKKTFNSCVVVVSNQLNSIIAGYTELLGSRYPDLRRQLIADSEKQSGKFYSVNIPRRSKKVRMQNVFKPKIFNC